MWSKMVINLLSIITIYLNKDLHDIGHLTY